MSQQRYRRPSNSGRSPTGSIPTLGPQPKRRFWALVVLMLLELLFLLAMLALWLWPYFVISNYVELNGNMVAQIQISTTRKPHLINVQLTLFDKNHNSTKVINCYMMQDDRLVLQGDLLTFTPWQNSISLHAGFKLTELLGCYSNASFMC